MIQQHSIKSLYPLALAEGEGVGTAYEYFAKRLKLTPWLQPDQTPLNILIAGLPEKYGSSLDFMLLASEMGSSVTIADERSAAIHKAKDALHNAQNSGLLIHLQPDFFLVQNMGDLTDLEGPFDLILSSETLQRIPFDAREAFINRLMLLAPYLALFMPNDDNPAHTNQSGLTGLQLDELQYLIDQNREYHDQKGSPFILKTGYIDMPPFPPGITRSNEQREHATSGKGEAIAMWGLGYFARFERFFPLPWRRARAHIVYALISKSQR
jgi:hypothetical protein